MRVAKLSKLFQLPNFLAGRDIPDADHTIVVPRCSEPSFVKKDHGGHRVIGNPFADELTKYLAGSRIPELNDAISSSRQELGTVWRKRDSQVHPPVFLP